MVSIILSFLVGWKGTNMSQALFAAQLASNSLQAPKVSPEMDVFYFHFHRSFAVYLLRGLYKDTVSGREGYRFGKMLRKWFHLRAANRARVVDAVFGGRVPERLPEQSKHLFRDEFSAEKLYRKNDPALARRLMEDRPVTVEWALNDTRPLLMQQGHYYYRTSKKEEKYFYTPWDLEDIFNAS